MAGNSSLAEELAGKVRGRVAADEPMSRHTTFGIGGNADLWVEPAGEEDLLSVLDFAESKGLKRKVFGNGSNFLVLDAGFRGIIISMKAMDGFRFAANIVSAESGARLKNLLGQTLKRGLSGLEFSAGIPATVGGAVATNAGGKFGEIGALTRKVKAASGGDVFELSGDRLFFGYRNSGFSGGESVIVRVELEFSVSDPDSVREKTLSVFRHRRRSQPLGCRSAGCVFKNPASGSAGILISSAGLGGKRVGGAEISPVHANFIVNSGGATASDVLALIALAGERVYGLYGISLEREVEVIGG